MILEDLGMEILSMKEAGVDVDIVEDGASFEENAEIKARAVARVLTNDIVLADDSGLEIDYLDKAPGIYSARFAGEDTSYDIKNNILLDRMEGVPDEERTARFVCAVAAVFPDGTVDVVRETIEGRVADAEGEVLYLESLAGQPAIIDSVELDKNGAFTFKQEAPQYPEFYQLRLNGAVVHFAVDSTETLNFTGSAKDF